MTFEVYEGEFVAIMGPSGSGKTTLLNLMGLIDTPTQGTIMIDGVDVNQLTEKERTSFRNAKLGFVFQFFNLIPELTALQNVMLPLIIKGTNSHEGKRVALTVLEAVNLSEWANHGATQLSGGQMQRVSIARALVNKPAIVLADEPTGNLDSKTAEEIMKLLHDLNTRNDQTFIIISHDPKTAEGAHRIIRLLDGQIESIKPNPFHPHPIKHR